MTCFFLIGSSAHSRCGTLSSSFSPTHHPFNTQSTSFIPSQLLRAPSPCTVFTGVLSCITCLDPLGPLWISRIHISVSSKPLGFVKNHSVSLKPDARLHLPSRGYFGTLHVPTSDRVTLALSERRGALLSNHSQRPSNQDTGKVPPYR